MALEGYDQPHLWKDVQDLLNTSMNVSYEEDPSLGTRGKALNNTLILLAYSCLCVISIFGNSLVCYVIFKNKRLHTATNVFIANLAVSDLLVTFINVPFNIMRHVLVNWPFGDVLCYLVNFTLMVSTYVSTYTLTSIALDRHRVVLKPLSTRMSKTTAAAILVVIWVVAVLLSLPFGMYMRVDEYRIVKVEGKLGLMYVKRCRASYPSAGFDLYFTVATMILQYCVPLTLIGVAYGRIVQSLWSRTHVGAVTANQQLSQSRAKRKSIKLLIAVVVVFALCWLPLNLYHLLTDLHPNPVVFSYNMNAFFACHWIAISSTCYNPFVYCWMNENFREEVKARFSCCLGRPFKYLHAKNNDRALIQKPKRRGLDSCLTRSSMTSSARAQSVLRELTLISDPEDFHSTKPSDGYLTDEFGDREEAQDLLFMYENGRVEYHANKLHNCIKG